MKKITTLLLITLCLTVSGQNRRPKTLIGNDPEQISGFGGVLFSTIPIKGNPSVLTGGGGAVLFDQTFFIGGYGLGLAGNHEASMDGEDVTSSFGHGGFWLGYNIRPDDLVHFGVETKLGWGELTTKSIVTNEQVSNEKAFIFNPQVFGEVNISYWFKANVTAGYHKSIGIDSPYYDPNDFDGPSFGVSLLFGWFN